MNMKKNILSIIFIIFGIIHIFISEPCLAETKNSINIGGTYWIGGLRLFGDDLTGSLFSLEYERFHSPSKLAILFRLSTANYNRDATPGWFGNKGEEGKVNGVDFGFRYYPIGHGNMKRLFLGGSIGLSQNEWTRESGYYRTKGDSNATKVDTEIGYRFSPHSEKISLMPAVHIGHYSVTNHNFNMDSELDGYYLSLSLSLGFKF
jgi:hypothetical protein